MSKRIVTISMTALAAAMFAVTAGAGPLAAQPALSRAEHLEAQLQSTSPKGAAVTKYWIGYMYDTGAGLPHDPAEAFKMIQAAAKKGVVPAERRLGEMYRDGNGAIQDYIRARHWLDVAATDGDVIAQRELGMLYANGTGVRRNPIRGYAWLDIAASGDDKLAIDKRDKLAKSMSPGDVNIANQLARAFNAMIQASDKAAQD
jgi:TPR repeat protein